MAQARERLETPLGRVVSVSAPTPANSNQGGGMSRKRRPERGFERVNLHAAGIDIGSTSHWVAVDPSVCDRPVRDFGAYTEDLHDMAEWLSAQGVRTVAMESTGVYWIPVYDLLRERGFDVCLVDARATKQVAGQPSSSGGVWQTTPAAPPFIASMMWSWPSPLAVLTARKSWPGSTRRESKQKSVKYRA